MKPYDKIRVLWIDDREESDGYPEDQIQPIKYQEWFEIVHSGHNSTSEAASIRSAEEFSPILRDFWFNKEQSVLPAEIIATDYNLSKRSGLSVLEQTDEEIDSDLMDFEDDIQSIEDQREPSPPNSPSIRNINFEGLLISLFYGSLTHRHPTAIVPMTRYLSKMPSEVTTLHTLVEPFLGIDFQYIDVKGRRWLKILQEGVKQLRNRILTLFQSGDITISPHDLVSISKQNEFKLITINSPYSSRKFPLEALFIDLPEEDRATSIRSWVSELFSHLTSLTDFTSALDISDQIWSYYIAKEGSQEANLLQSRQELSVATANKIDSEELSKLRKLFKVDNKDCAISVEIRNFNVTNQVKRLVIIIIAFRLATHFIHVKNKMVDLGFSVTFPQLIENDLWFALFPLPKNPIVLPFDNTKYRSNTWEKVISRLELSIPDILLGKPFNAENRIKGLHQWERHLMRCLATSEEDIVKGRKLEESDFYNFSTTRLMLWGDGNEYI